MTVGAEAVVTTHSEFVVPKTVRHVEGGFSGYLSWSEVLDESGHHEVRLGDLLPDFVALERATAVEMIAFLETYGIPELCGRHDLPDQHVRGTHCDLGVLENGDPALSVSGIHKIARGFAAASRLGVALAARNPGEKQDWLDLQKLGSWHWVGDEFESEDWRYRRGLLAHWLTGLLRDCGVQALAQWHEGGRLTVTPEADGLMGALALALAYDVGQREGYACSVCGTPVDRVRPPLPGEAVYCKKPACKREQQRINQKAYRARKRGESEN